MRKPIRWHKKQKEHNPEKNDENPKQPFQVIFAETNETVKKPLLFS